MVKTQQLVQENNTQETAQTVPTRRRKKKASKNAIKEIKNEQKKTTLIIPKAPIHRLITEIAKNYKADLRFKSEAYAALHAAAETHLIDVLSRANKCAIHDKRETIQSKDMHLALDLSQ